eukprot:765650-Hanusia_phi.AAC.2
MPAELVDKSRIFYSEEKGCFGTGAGVSSGCLAAGNPRALTEDEIDRVLEEVEEDSELMRIHKARLEELAKLSKLRLTQGKQQEHTGTGEVEVADPATVPKFIMGGARIVLLVTREDEKLCPLQGELSSGILKNMRALAKEFLGTGFLHVSLNSKYGDDLRSRLQITQLPALICCRQGVIVSRVMGTALTQFVLMETVGSVVLQAWLNQAGVLCTSMGDEAEVGRPSEQRSRDSKGSDSDMSSENSDSDDETSSDNSKTTNFHARSKNERASGSKTFAR